jgi:hypothetical protein
LELITNALSRGDDEHVRQVSSGFGCHRALSNVTNLFHVTRGLTYCRLNQIKLCGVETMPFPNQGDREKKKKKKERERDRERERESEREREGV